MAVSGREKREKEVKELREAQGLVAHKRTEVSTSVNGVEVHTVAGAVFLKTYGEVELDQTGLFQVQQALQAAFQAVS